jgi:uncharacterized protein
LTRTDPSTPEWPTTAIETVDRPNQRRYELTVDGDLAGWVTYRLSDRRITFIHTEVQPAWAGRGLAQRLAADVLDDARARGLRVRPICPYIAAFIRSHPAYQDLVAGPEVKDG